MPQKPRFSKSSGDTEHDTVREQWQTTLNAHVYIPRMTSSVVSEYPSGAQNERNTSDGLAAAVVTESIDQAKLFVNTPTRT